MPVEVTLKWSDGGYSDTRAEDMFQVTGVVNEYEAARASGPPWGAIPQFNSTHRSNSNLKAEVPFARQIGFGFYEVLVAYSVPEGAGDHPGGTIDPLTEPAQIEWGFREEMEAVDRDINGTAITNSAFDPFDPHPTRVFITWQLAIYKNKPSYNFAQAAAFQNAVNSNTFTLAHPGGAIAINPGSCKCVGILPAARFSANAAYVPMVHRFEFREYPVGTPLADKTVAKSPFQMWLADVGYRANYTENGVIKPGRIVDGEGAEVTFPVRLNGAGVPVDSEHKVTTQKLLAFITPGVPSIPLVPAGSIYFLVYQNCRGADFSTLGL